MGLNHACSGTTYINAKSLTPGFKKNLLKVNFLDAPLSSKTYKLAKCSLQHNGNSLLLDPLKKQNTEFGLCSFVYGKKVRIPAGFEPRASLIRRSLLCHLSCNRWHEMPFFNFTTRKLFLCLLQPRFLSMHSMSSETSRCK